MRLRFFLTVMIFVTFTPVYGQEQKTVPEKVYNELEYIISLSQSKVDPDPEKLSALISFVGSSTAESSMVLPNRQGSAGAAYTFSLQVKLSKILNYAYNPDIPSYVTMPSSLQNQQWLTPQARDGLRNLAREVRSFDKVHLVRGRDRETITPDTHTGGYYIYDQDRIVIMLPGPTGPVLIAATSQADMSKVGKKGCVVGDDKNWDYLYSDTTGLNKTGLGWVDSYMYSAYSVVIYVAESSLDVVRVASFKWLNAGWARINLVESHHIQNGIKRFVSDFKEVLESPGLPDAAVLANKYRELQQNSDQELRRMVAPYLHTLSSSSLLEECPDFFKDMVSSGEYLDKMSHDEIVRVLLLQYVKGHIRTEPLVGLAAHRMENGQSTVLSRQ